jgi:hypothetical protein
MYNFENYVFWLFLILLFVNSKGCCNFPKGHIPPIRNPYFEYVSFTDEAHLRRSERLKNKKYNYKY